MLEGITILNQTEIMEMSGAGLTWGLILVIGGIIGAIVFCILADLIDSNFAIGAVLCMVAFVAGIIVFAITDRSVPTGRYQYEVTIDESVNFKDLYTQYDVIEQRGNIYILEDKEMSE